MQIALISNQAKSMINFRGPLIEELVRRGHKVLALAPDFEELTRSECEKLGARPVDFTMSRTGMNPFRELAAILELRRLLKTLCPDVVLSFFLKPVIYGTIAAASAKIEQRFALIEGLGFAFTPSGGFDLRRFAVQLPMLLLTRFAMKRLDKVIMLNRDDRNELIDRGLVPSGATCLLGAIGLDLDEWPELPLPRERVVFILVARLLADKGIREFVEAVRIVRRSNCDARFLLLGGLDDNPTAISSVEVNSWVTEGLIEWPGHVPVRPWLAIANVFVLPSYREGLPRSTQEAMAMGRPVVTTDVPGCRDTVIEGRNGFKVPARDPEALANAMKYFIEQPCAIATMGAESRRIAEKQFDAQLQNCKLLDLMGIGYEPVTREVRSDVSTLGRDICRNQLS